MKVGSPRLIPYCVGAWLAAAAPLPSGTYNEWVAGHFTAAQAAAGDAGPHADPDRDGRPNLVEYALGGRPVDCGSIPRWSIEPATRSVVFPSLPDRFEATTRVECSANLSTWHPAAKPTSSGGSSRSGLAEGMRFARLVTEAAAGAVLDSDGDGLHDLFEEALARESPGDGHQCLGDIRPQDDFDGDGIANALEPANRAPGPRSNPGPALIDPRRVAMAIDALSARSPLALEVHTPLDE